MRSLPANARKQAAEETLMLPFRVPPQEWFTLQQAAGVMGVGESTAERLYEKNELTGHSHNAGDGERKHKRVMRAALIAYMIKTADYTDESFCDLYCSALPYLPAKTLLEIARIANRLAIDAPLNKRA